MDKNENVGLRKDEDARAGRKPELVSVYMPTRNRVHLLGNAIDSVLSQSYRTIELIVVNDGSTDETDAYLARRAAGDPRLTVVSNAKAQGAPASRNIAILKARGKFITGLDDDDSFGTERIGAFVEYWNLLTARNTRPACLYSQDILVDDNGIHLDTSKKRSSVSAEDLFVGNYIGNQIFAPREHFILAGLFDERLPAWQDLEFFIRVLQHFGDARLLDMATYVHAATLRPDRISAQQSRIRAAFELVTDKHAREVPARQKALFLQMFDDNYNITPRAQDWVRFLRWGEWPTGVLRLLRSTLGIRRRLAQPTPLVLRTVDRERLPAGYGNI